MEAKHTKLETKITQLQEIKKHIDKREKKARQKGRTPNDNDKEWDRSEVERALKDLDLTGVNLLDLKVLQEFETTLPEYLKNLRIDRNSLNNIDSLNKFHQLKTLDASGNFISSVNLQLDQLVVLKLQKNYLTELPDLNFLEKLEDLDVSQNQINNLTEVTRKLNNVKSQARLIKLDFSSNKIKPEKWAQKQFENVIMKFKSLKSLNFHVSEQKDDQKKVQWTMNQFPKCLQLINNMTKDNFRKIGQIDHDGNVEQLSDEGNEEGPLNLDMICNLLQEANNNPDPSVVLHFVQKLEKKSDKIYDLSLKQGTNFKFTLKCGTMLVIQEKIEVFVQNSQLLIENNYDIRKTMLKILVKLTVVHNPFLVQRCFETLANMFIFFRKEISDIMKREIIHKINEIHGERNKISHSLINGLLDYVETTNCGDILELLLQQNFFYTEIRKFKLEFQKIKDGQLHKNEIVELEEKYITQFSLLVIAIEKGGKGDVQEFTKKNLPSLVQIFFKIDHESEFYYVMLQILKNCALMSKKIAGALIKERVYNEVKKKLDYRYNRLMSNGSTIPSNNSNKSQLDLKFFRIFSSEIETVASLFNTQQELLVLELLKGSDGQIGGGLSFQLIKSLAPAEPLDPLLLTALCKLTHAMLLQPLIHNDPKILQQIVKSIDSCNELIPYLGMDKYLDMKKIVEKHCKGSPNQTSVETDENPITHKLFISIIQLINFFCEGNMSIQKPRERISMFSVARNLSGTLQLDRDSELKKIYESVCQEMNGRDREEALFGCLESPEDDVKVKVVECLFNVELDQLSPDEVSKLITAMKSRNVGAGQTELVLSHIFWIFCKFQLDAKKKEEMRKFLEEAVTYGVKILQKNQARDLEDEEELKEKYMLSISIISFLKLHNQDQHNPPPASREALLKNVLYFEQTFTTQANWRLVPIDVQETELGDKVKQLMDLIIVSQEDNERREKQTLEPYNYVSFRVLHRMANLLSYVPSRNNFETFSKTKKIFPAMTSYYRKGLLEKIEMEKDLWRNIDSSLIGRLRDKAGFSFTDFKQNHDYFSNIRQKDGIYHLITFLIQKNKNNEQWLYQKSQNLNYLVEKMEKFQHVQSKCASCSHVGDPCEKKLSEKFQDYLDIQKNDEFVDINEMTMCFKDQKLGEGYEYHEKMTKKLSVLKENLPIESSNDELGIKNAEMRVLSVAALLRIIYASIQFAPNKRLAKMAEENLSADENDFYMDLTRLCYSTGWFAGNIGVKFLMVMRFTTMVHHSQKFIEPGQYKKYRLFAWVIKQVLRKLNSEIMGNGQIRQKLPPEKHLLINQISTLCFQLCKQSQFFELSEGCNHEKLKFVPLEKDACIYETELEVNSHGYFNRLGEMLEQLFDFNMVKTLINIMFQDQEISFKLLSTKKKQRTFEDSQDEDEDFSMNDEVFFEVRNAKISTREHIKSFLGMFIALCGKDIKYKIIEYISRSLIFEYKTIRKSLYNEILILSKQERTTRYLSRLYFENIGVKTNPNLMNLPLDKHADLIRPDEEHTVLARTLQLQIWRSTLTADDDYRFEKRFQSSTNKGDDEYLTRFLVCTNRGIYIFNDHSCNSCKNCETYMLCPAGNKPQLLFSFKYKQIAYVRKFNLAVQKFFLTFKIDKQSQSYEQYKKSSLYEGHSKSDIYLTLAILFHRVNAAYFIQKTIDEFIEFNKMNNVKSHIDFLLEYSIYFQAITYLNYKQEINKAKRFQHVKPEIIRYICYFKSIEELDKFYDSQKKVEVKDASSHLTYDCIPMQATLQKDGTTNQTLPHMRILVISAFRLMIFNEFNSKWESHKYNKVTASLKQFKVCTVNDQDDYNAHTDKIRDSAANFTQQDISMPLSRLKEINCPDRIMPILDLVFERKDKNKADKHVVLVFLGDLSREQVLELLSELKEHPDSDNEDQN